LKLREVTDQELQRIINLKDGIRPASWSKIERETKVPRQIAKRVYNDWKRLQSLQNLQNVRMQIAGEEFKRHADILEKFALAFVLHLPLPASLLVNGTADEVLEAQLWSKDLLDESGDREVYKNDDEMISRRRKRQNKLLMKALQEHTQGTVKWDVFQEWRSSWDRYVVNVSALQKKTLDTLTNYLKQEQGFRSELESKTKRRDIPNALVEGFLKLIWRNVSTGKADESKPDFISFESQKDYEIAQRPRDLILPVRIPDRELSDKVATILTRTAEILWREDEVRDVANELNTMSSKKVELEEQLEPLLLRPMILRTRCELCPA